MPPRDWLLIGHEVDPRTIGFQAALERAGEPAARLLTWADLLPGRVSLSEMLRPGGFVRIESPGRNAEVERLLIAAGAEVPDLLPAARISAAAALELPFDRGRIQYLRQWFLGFRAVLRRLAEELAGGPGCRVLNPPAHIELMFDKLRCQEHLAAHNVPIPPRPRLIDSWDDLQQWIQTGGPPRLFLKPLHGSSAMGVIAYQTNGARHIATTSVELVQTGGEVQFYNSRRIARYESPEQIAVIVNELAREGLYAEPWIPKARVTGKACDLRVVVIGGEPRQTVLRLSDSPLTNLHLLNERAEPGLLQAQMRPQHWANLQETCRRAAAAFPHSLYAGIDLLVSSDLRGRAVLEVNAFGDLLHGVTDRGEGTYDAEIAVLLADELPQRTNPNPDEGYPLDPAASKTSYLS